MSKPPYFLCACLIAKNEAAYLLEWIAFHRSVGFEYFWIYNNDSTDDTVELLSELQKDGICCLIDWPRARWPVNPQVEAYRDAVGLSATQTRWLAIIDADEFVVPLRGTSVADVLRETPFREASSVLCNWRIFGSSGHSSNDGRPCIERFQFASAADFHSNHNVKAIVDPSRVETAFIHNHYMRAGAVLLSDGSPVSNPTEEFHAPPSAAALSINHYFCKSKQEFEAKRLKGLADYALDAPNALRQAAAFANSDRNEVANSSAARFLKATKTEMRRLAMSMAEANIPSAKKELLPMSVRDEMLTRIWRDYDPFRNFPADKYEPDMQGWGSNHPYLTEAIQKVRPAVVVEVGVWKGGSTITMASEMRRLGIDGVVISVDTWLGAWDHWSNPEWFPHLKMEFGQPMIMKTFMKNVVEADLAAYVVPLPLDSINAAEALRLRSVSVDLFHLDGGHDYAAVMSDLESWWPLLRPGATVIGDDYYTTGEWPGVREAFDEFLASHGISSMEHRDGKCRITKPS